MSINEWENALTDWKRELREATGQYDLFRLLKAISKAQGYAYFSVVRMPCDGESRLEDVTVVSNWPPELIKEYDRHELLQGNPITPVLARSNAPMHWDLASLSRYADTQKAAAAQTLFAGFGIHSGICLPVSSASGVRGMVAFAGEDDFIDETEIAVLALQTSRIFNRLISFQNEARDTSVVELSERELQCLHLLASGLATGRIAQDLDLSEHTVNHHITTLSHKLGAKNRAHAVSIGFRLNILR